MRVWAAFCQVASDWPHPVMARTLRLTVQNRRLTSDCNALVNALALANNTYERGRRQMAQLVYERDEALELATSLRSDLSELEAFVAAISLKELPDVG